MKPVARFFKKVQFLLERKKFGEDLDEEMAYHREEMVRDLIARGMAPEEAQIVVRRQFGNATRLKERSHEAVGFRGEGLVRDFRYALRQLARSPGFALAVIVTLALGIGATTAIFTLVQATMLRRLPYPQADRIVNISDVRLHGRSTGGLVGVPRFFDMAARNNSFERVAYFYFDNPTLIVGAQLPTPLKAVGVSGQFWDVFGVQPLMGRTFDEKDTEPNKPEVAVLSYGAWRQIFSGDAKVVGKVVTLDKKAATIVGVMPANFDMPGDIELWLPSDLTPNTFRGWRGDGSRFVNVFGRLKTGVSAAAATSDLHRIGEQLQGEHADSDADWQFGSEPLRDHMYGAYKPALIILLSASSLLLLIGCFNVANLLMSRATTREREVAVRRALGASQARIVLQFLMESMLLALGGGCLGLATAFALVRGVSTMLPGRLGLPGTVSVDWPVVWFAFAISIATGIAFGLTPAWKSRKVEVSLTLKRGESRIAGAHGGAMRNAFIAVQVSLSLVLLVGASLLTESLWRLMKSPLGFEPDHVLTFEIKLPWNGGPGVDDFFREVQRRMETLPGVSAVGQIDALPTADWHLRSNFDADWLPRVVNQPAINAEDRHIAGNYLQAMGVSLLAGRGLTEEDATAKVTPILVNQQLAQQYHPTGSIIGRHLMIGKESFEIVGVITNARGTAGSIAQTPGAEVYFPADGDQGVVQRSFVLRSQLPPEQLTRAIQEQVHEIDAQQAIRNVSTMDDLISTSVAQPRLNMILLGSFAAIALVLACVGVYGVVAYSVAQRRQEIGIRMALGAKRAQICAVFMRRALAAAFAGIGMGSVVALLLTRLLGSQLYEVKPNNPVVYAVSIGLLLIPVLVATLRPALRAAFVNPVDALRAE
jgi:predicted permease